MRTYKIVFTLFFLLAGTTVFAEEPPIPPLGGNAPIDGAIALLILVGAGYGVYSKNKN